MGEHVSAKEIIINTTEPNFEYRENKYQIIIYDKDKNIDFMVFDNRKISNPTDDNGNVILYDLIQAGLVEKVEDKWITEQ